MHFYMRSSVIFICLYLILFFMYFTVRLKQHTLKKHPTPEQLIHKCTKCPRSFSTKRILKLHLITHTDETPFGCELCDKSYKTNSKF